MASKFEYPWLLVFQLNQIMPMAIIEFFCCKNFKLNLGSSILPMNKENRKLGHKYILNIFIELLDNTMVKLYYILLQKNYVYIGR